VDFGGLSAVNRHTSWPSGQLPRPECLRRSEGGACVRLLRVGLIPARADCSAGPDASGDLISRDRHAPPRQRSRATERHTASRLRRRSGFWGRLTTTNPCRETHRGLVGTPALADCLWPVMDRLKSVELGRNGSHALLPSLLARSARSVRKGTPRDRLGERRGPTVRALSPRWVRNGLDARTRGADRRDVGVPRPSLHGNT